MSSSRNNARVYIDDSESGDDRRRRKSGKHKKKHKRRSRSSTSSPSPSRPSHQPSTINRVHINPAVANPLLFDARMMHEQMQQKDMQIHQMGAELTSSLARINVMDVELRNAISARSNSEQRVTLLEQQNTRLQGTLTEIRKVISTLESGIDGLRKEKETLEQTNKEMERREKIALDEQRSASGAYSAAKEQAEFMAKRNEVLAKKVEEYISKVKQLETEKEELTVERDRSRGLAEGMRTSLLQSRERAEKAENEILNLRSDIDKLTEKETSWRNEKNDLEKKIFYKESQMRSERKQRGEETRLAREKYDKLEDKFRNKNGGFDTEIAVNTVSKTLFDIRNEFTSQFEELRKRVGLPAEIVILEDTIDANASKLT